LDAGGTTGRSLVKEQGGRPLGLGQRLGGLGLADVVGSMVVGIGLHVGANAVGENADLALGTAEEFDRLEEMKIFK
jgi:hypothetical protein